jgi:tetratricopeptide (TPR) repeat protein
MPTRFAIGCVIWTLITTSAFADEMALRPAHKLLLTGKYAEAEEAFGKVGEEDAEAAALGIARSQLARGERDAAWKTLQAAIEKQKKSAKLQAELGLLLFERGEHDKAHAAAKQAIELDENALAARWLLAELHLSRGEMQQAEDAYAWLIDYQANDGELNTAEDYVWVGRAAAQYARWKRNKNEFRNLVNEFWPEVLEKEPNFWPANLETALLFLEKYNQPAATAELNAALVINPQAAELYVVRAGLAMQTFDLKTADAAIARALAINPQLIAALQFQGALRLADGRAEEAVKILERARNLNPRDEETLGRLAAAYFAVDGYLPDDADSRASKIIAAVVEYNPHCGRFYESLADSFDLMRRYPQAATYYREARERMPQLLYVEGHLGLVLMRLGEEDEAGKLLTKSFAIDPFNVRVKNMLEVLDVLQGYAVIETEHFILKFDRGQDELLAKYAAKYLEEEVYPEIVAKLGYEPEGKSLFEIFSRAKNTSGHGWFSARMVGLPFIGTVGACAGKVVALASPSSMPQKFHWGRVLKHEFVHVVNLQQTNFNIPHWYTEGLAVRLEDMPRPTQWNEVLAQRLTEDTLFNLDTINLGFIRPANSNEWALAYAQAELYCDYLVATYGDDALAKLLAAYRDNLSTRAALKREFQVEHETFEQGYREYVQKVVTEFQGKATNPNGKMRTRAELERAVKDDPDNPDLLAQLALAHLEAKDLPSAREIALKVQKVDAKNTTAAFVLASVQLSIGDQEQALELLIAAQDATAPHEQLLTLLAALKFQQGEYADAESLYKLGAKFFAPREKWLKALAKVYLRTENNVELAKILEELAGLEYDNATLRKKLAQLALARRDWKAAERWAVDALFIDLADAQLHAQVAEARVNLQHWPGAIEEYRAALALDPEQHAWRLALADAHLAAGEKAEAREVLEKLIELAPDFPGAKLMLEQLPR